MDVNFVEPIVHIYKLKNIKLNSKEIFQVFTSRPIKITNISIESTCQNSHETFFIFQKESGVPQNKIIKNINLPSSAVNSEQMKILKNVNKRSIIRYSLEKDNFV